VQEQQLLACQPAGAGGAPQQVHQPSQRIQGVANTTTIELNSTCANAGRKLSRQVTTAALLVQQGCT
jgi:RNA-splicing ligase RtcB